LKKALVEGFMFTHIEICSEPCDLSCVLLSPSSYEPAGAHFLLSNHMIIRLIIIYLGVSVLTCNLSWSTETQSIDIAVLHQRHTRDTISIT